EVDAHADDRVPLEARRGARLGNRLDDRLDPVAGVLERPVPRQPRARSGQRRLDHAVRVFGDRGPALLSRARLDQQRADRCGSEVEPERAGLLARGAHARYCAGWCRSSESSMSPQRLTWIPRARAIEALRTSARVAVAASGPYATWM